MKESSEQEIFWNLLGKVLYNQATESEAVKFRQIIIQNEELMSCYLKINQVLNELPLLGLFEKIDVDADWKKVYAKIMEKKISGGRFRRMAGMRFSIPLPLAAAVILLIIFLGYLLPFSNRSIIPVEDQYTVIEAPLGSRTKVLLEDGSTVWLNAGSTLRYSSRFNQDNRNLFLEGEAFFEVEKHETPFIVNISDISFIVLGTSFNLKAYNDDETIEATLVSGTLKVEDGRYTDKRFSQFLLSPNQKAVFHKSESHYALKNAADENSGETDIAEAVKLSRIEVRGVRKIEPEISWKDGILIVEGESLAELARKLERRYDVLFVFNDDRLKEVKYSGTIRNQTLEQVLQAMKLTSPVDFSLSDKTVTLYINASEWSRYLSISPK
jgi:transmembrane sensor